MALLALLFFAAPGHADEIRIPQPGSPERLQVLEAARSAAEAEIGFPVGLSSSTLRTYGNWAFVQGVPTTETGSAIDWSTTRFARDMRDGFMSDVVMVLMQRDSSSWSVAAHIFGPTDVYWYGWRDQYQLPEELFFSQWEWPVSEEDWAGPAPQSPAVAPTVTQVPAHQPPAWRDPSFGFTLALPNDWRVETSDQNGLHMVVALAPQDEAAVITLAVKVGYKLAPEQLLGAVEPLLIQNIITQARKTSTMPRHINGLDGLLVRYAGTYMSRTGPIASSAETFYTSDEANGYVLMTVLPDFMAQRWQRTTSAILESFGFGPGIAAEAPVAPAEPPAARPAPAAAPGSNAAGDTMSVAKLQALLPPRPDGRDWGLALTRDAPETSAGYVAPVSARYIGFAPDGPEPYDTELDILIFNGPSDQLDALFAECRTAPGAQELSPIAVAIAIGGTQTEIWLRRPDELIRVSSQDRSLALAYAQILAR